MIFYLLSIIADMIGISVIDIFVLHYWLGEVSIKYVIYQVVINVVYVLLIDIVVVLVFYFVFPKKWFNPISKNFKASERERRFYNFLRIRKWKDKIPAGIGFRKDRVYEKDNPDYIFRFLQDSAIAEKEHLVSALIGWIIIFLNPFTPLNFSVAFALPVCIVHFVLHMMPVMVQRYNRPKLILLYKRLNDKKIRQMVDSGTGINVSTDQQV